MNLFMSAVLPALLTMVIAYLLGSVSSSIIFTNCSAIRIFERWEAEMLAQPMFFGQ